MVKYVKIKLGDQTHMKFKSACTKDFKTMQDKIEELIKNYIEEMEE